MTAFHLPLEERSISALLRKHASAMPDKPFMTIAGRSVTFAEADARCRALARGFAGRSVREGGRVMIMLPNCLEFMLSWIAATLVGAAAVPINPTVKGVLLEMLLKDASPDAIVIHATLAEELASVDAALVPPLVAMVGNAGPSPLLIVHVLVKGPQGWQLVSRQATRPTPPPSAATPTTAR